MRYYATIPTMAEASEQQRKLFFALVKEAGFEAEAMKERAKKKFGLESFNQITSAQVSELIDTLQEKTGVETKPKEKHTHNFEANPKFRVFTCKCGTLVIEPR